MIVKMKKVYLVVLDSAREKALNKLRDLGVLHIEREYKSSEAVNTLIEKKVLFERCLLALPQVKGKAVSPKEDSYSFSEAEKIAERISSIQENIRQLEDEIEKERKDIISLAPWGDFTTSSVEELSQKGFKLSFYELSKEQMAALPDGVRYIRVNSIKNTSYIIVADIDGSAGEKINAEPFALPHLGISMLKADIEGKTARKASLSADLEAFSQKREILSRALSELEIMLDFESVSAEMGTEERFAYISGYAPVDRIDRIKSESSNMHWAMIIRDPEESETPPTLIRNPKWVDIIQPLFKFLDTTPGYRELDISMLFLTFFTVFVAMIVGDAGYGVIFLAMTMLMWKKMKNAPGQVIALLSILSLATIAWGVITGTWFGSKTLAELPVLRSLIIPQIASFGPEDTSAMVQQLSFIIGMTHLTIGILISFIRKMPSLAAIAEIGWLIILYAAYFAARFFVLDAPINPLALPLFIAGFALVCLFSEQNGKNIFKGILLGIAWSPMKFLNSVSMFADLVSYIRLFAVGLATVAVAQSFNTMASAFEGIPGMIIAAVILFLAHTFNMAMSLLAVVVHGVRLNMLEFGGKIGMEWSGYAYNPFRKKDF